MSSDEFSSNSEATDSESDSPHNAFGIWLIWVILSSAPPHFPFTGRPVLQVYHSLTTTTNWLVSGWSDLGSA